MMKRTGLALAVLLATLAALAWAETSFDLITATTTSQTVTFPTQRQSVTLCNDGAAVAYFRLFNEYDTPAAATTSSSSIGVGACVGFGKPQTSPAYYKAISVVTAASTATVRVYSE